MRFRTLALALALVPSLASAAKITHHADGTVAECYGAALAGDLGRLVRESPMLFVTDARAVADLRLVETREALTGRYVHYRQFLDGIEVIDGGLVGRLDSAGNVAEFHNRLTRRFVVPLAHLDRNGALAALHRERPDTRQQPLLAEQRVLLSGKDDRLHLAQRFVVKTAPLEPFAFFIDLTTGELIRSTPLFFNASEARVFASNPVTALNDSTLHDNDDAATAVPQGAYAAVTLAGLPASGPLVGPHVQIIDVESPRTKAADASTSLVFDRSQDEFEDVMAYYHLDASQRYIQSLGYVDARRIIRRAIRVDAHAAGGTDNSFYQPSGAGEGTLYFGDGGVDDAEDPDILFHEYGHAIQDAIAPGSFGGGFSTEARALGEGFGDYWAFSQGYAAALASGRDPFCIGDWDARCGGGASTSCGYPAGSDCLRRVDGPKTMDDYLIAEQRGIEHRNGEIWSSALHEIFLAIVGRDGFAAGRPNADRLILESHFGMPPLPRFKTAARRLLETDRLLYAGNHAAIVCAAMTTRKIFTASDCDLIPRGDFTMFQSLTRNTIIPDASNSGIALTRTITDSRIVEQVQVRVNILHPHRGDLRLTLTGPNGRSVVLQSSSGDTSADLRTTYGFDTEPRDSLAVFSGFPANGVWTLQVSDVASQDVGQIVSWDLLIKFQGDEPITTRGRSDQPRKHLVVAANAPGAFGTRFLTDVRILNRGSEEVRVQAFLTASGEDGTSSFSAIAIAVSPDQTVALDDIVRNDFRTSGIGNVEFRGEVGDLLITSRTYNDATDMTYGQFIPAIDTAEAISEIEGSLHLPQLQNTAAFRTNVGVVDVTGSGALVELRVLDDRGQEVERRDLTLFPFSHIQLPIAGGFGGPVREKLRCEIRVVGGLGRVAAYGSVVDNATGDAIFVPALRLPLANEPVRILATVRAPGANGTRWRTDLWMFNRSDAPKTLDLTFFPSTTATPMTRQVALESHSLVAMPDLVGTTFGLDAIDGQLAIDGPDLAEIAVTARTWTEAAAGSYGQFIGGRRVSEAIGPGDPAVQMIQLESSAEFRTNLGVAEVTGQPARVRFRLFDASGREILAADRDLRPNQQLQLSLILMGAPAFTNGRASLEVIGGSGRVLAYASVIDNRSGDPIFVPAR